MITTPTNAQDWAAVAASIASSLTIFASGWSLSALWHQRRMAREYDQARLLNSKLGELAQEMNKEAERLRSLREKP